MVSKVTLVKIGINLVLIVTLVIFGVLIMRVLEDATLVDALFWVVLTATAGAPGDIGPHR
jgi:hypothetical protein